MSWLHGTVSRQAPWGRVWLSTGTNIAEARWGPGELHADHEAADAWVESLAALGHYAPPTMEEEALIRRAVADAGGPAWANDEGTR